MDTHEEKRECIDQTLSVNKSMCLVILLLWKDKYVCMYIWLGTHTHTLFLIVQILNVLRDLDL